MLNNNIVVNVCLHLFFKKVDDSLELFYHIITYNKKFGAYKQIQTWEKGLEVQILLPLFNFTVECLNIVGRCPSVRSFNKFDTNCASVHYTVRLVNIFLETDEININSDKVQ